MKQRQLTNEELSFLCRELANLFAAGIGAGDAFALLGEDEGDGRFRTLFRTLSQAADEGMPLHQAFATSGIPSSAAWERGCRCIKLLLPAARFPTMSAPFLL